MKKFFSGLLCVVLCVLLLNFEGTAAETAVSNEPIISVQDAQILFAWQLPAVEIGVEAGHTTVHMPGLENVQEPGLPQLPTKSFLLTLPVGAEPEVVIEEVLQAERPYAGNLAIAPQPQGVVLNGDGEAIGGDYVPAEAQSFDKPMAVLEEIGVMRGVRLARLHIYPVRPAGDQLQVVQNLRLSIQLNAPATLNKAAAVAEMDAFTGLIAETVINPTQVEVAAQELMAAPSSVSVVSSSATTAVLRVNKVGITAVTYADLAAIGFPVASVDPHKLHLTHNGAQVAMEWVGDGDTQFGSNEKFFFYAPAWSDRWMNEDVYLLSAEAANGLRIALVSGAPASLSAGVVTRQQLIEENNLYTPNCICAPIPAGRDGDRWAWDDLRNPGRPSNSYPLSLSNVNSAQAAKLTLWMIGFTAVANNPDHQVNVSLNGTALGSVTWDGKTAVTKTLTIPANVLQNSNSMQLTLPGIASIDGIWLDAVQIEYKQGTAQLGATTQGQLRGETTPRAYTISMASTTDVRVYNVTNATTPARLSSMQISANQIRFGDALTGTQEYAIATNSSVNTPAAMRMATPLLTAATSGADYIIVVPKAFMPALAPLKALRQSQGMTVVVEDVQAIYDGFGYGRSTPEAIHDYLDNAYHSWTPKPEFVLLVGDGSYDPKQNKADSKPTWIPPYLAVVDPWIGEVAADNRFVTVDGADILPDMALGRLPANNLAEVQTIIAKIVQYETNPQFGDWNSKVMAVTDNKDGAGDFVQFSDALLNKFVSDPWLAVKNYYNPAAGATVAEKDALKNQVSTAVLSGWNQGQGIIMYTGHSSIHQWAAERLFHLDDVPALSNGGRLPVVLQMTCFTGAFDEPFWDTMDEGLLRRANGGAVATWGPTGLGVATGHDALADGFLQTVVTNGTPELGRATMAGKLHLMSAKPSSIDLIDTFTLLGDPATRYDFDFWPGYTSHLPLIQK